MSTETDNENSEHWPHSRWEEQTAALALHALSIEEEELLEVHLETCDACRAELASHEEALGWLAGSLTGETVPSMDSILEAVKGPQAGADADADAQAGQAHVGSDAGLATSDGGRSWASGSTRPGSMRRGTKGTRSKRPRRALGAAMAGVAAIAAALSILFSLPSGRGGNTSPCSQASSCHAIVLREIVTTGSGPVVATVSISHRRAHLVAHGLPANTPRRAIYVLWQLRAHHQPVALGAFRVPKTGAITKMGVTLAQSYRVTQGFALSLERGPVPPPAPTDPVAEGLV